MCQLTKTKEREHPSRAWIITKRQKSLVFFFLPPVSPSFVCLVNPSVVYSEFSTNKMEDHSLCGAHTTHVSILTPCEDLSRTRRGSRWKQNCRNSVNPTDAFGQFILNLPFAQTSGLFLSHCSWWQTQTMQLQWNRTELCCVSCWKQRGDKGNGSKINRLFSKQYLWSSDSLYLSREQNNLITTCVCQDSVMNTVVEHRHIPIQSQ